MAETSKNVLKLVIADDHAVVRKGLAAFIEIAPDIELVAAATTGAEAIDAARRANPDIVLLDLLLPDKPAAETIAAIKSSSPDSEVIVLTSYEGHEQIGPVIKAGALSYLLKDTLPDDLISAIRRAARGERTISPQVAHGLLVHRAQGGEDRPLHDDLTARELEVLQAIAEGRSNSEIAGALGISGKTVKSHVGNILAKLCVADRTQAAVYAWREGVVS